MPSGSPSGSIACTLILGEMRASTWSAQISRFSARQNSITCSGAWPPPVSTSKVREPIGSDFTRDQPPERARQARDHSQVAMPGGEEPLGGVGVEPVRAIEAEIRLGVERGRIEVDGEAAEIFGLAHQERQAEALGEPAGEPHVVGVIMGDQDTRERPPAQRTRKQRIPGRARRLVVEAGVEHRPAGAVLDQVDIDVIEPERQREPHPQDAGRDLDRRPGRGRRQMREGQCG